MRSRASSDSERSGKERSAPRPGGKIRKSQCPSTFSIKDTVHGTFHFRGQEGERERERDRGREGQRGTEREKEGEGSGRERTTVAS
jgi:hypothetical protein